MREMHVAHREKTRSLSLRRIPFRSAVEVDVMMVRLHESRMRDVSGGRWYVATNKHLSFLSLHKTMSSPTFFLFPALLSASLYECTMTSHTLSRASLLPSSPETSSIVPKHSSSVSKPILCTLNGHRTEKHGSTSRSRPFESAPDRSLNNVRVETMIGASGVRFRRELSQTLGPRAFTPTLASRTLRRRHQYRASTAGLSLVHR
jgi:hypothetical protein